MWGDGTIFVDPSPYAINLLIAYDENTFSFCSVMCTLLILIRKAQPFFSCYIALFNHKRKEFFSRVGKDLFFFFFFREKKSSSPEKKKKKKIFGRKKKREKI